MRRQSVRRILPAAAAVVAFTLGGGSASAQRLVWAGRWPVSDRGASREVVRSSWEPRPGNAAADRATPTAAQLRVFHRQSSMPYARWVTGRFAGTTDEIIQWAARKWGFAPDLFRAVAAVESWWRMGTVGNGGTAFGLFQVREPYHCQGQVCSWFAHDTAFNADYYGAVLRSYYDGTQTWLNTVSGNGARYNAHDLWGSVGFWSAGRWHVAAAEAYDHKVRGYLFQRVWRSRGF